MRLPLAVLLLSLALCALPTPGQTPRPDSLRRLLSTQHQPDTTRLRRLLALSEELSAADARQATKFSQQALALAQKLGSPTGEGRALLSLSKLYRRQTNYDTARYYARRAQRLFAHRADRQGEGKAWLQLSLSDMLQSNLTPALAEALKGLPAAEQAGDRQTSTRLQASIGDIYFKMGNYEEAIPTLHAALTSGQRTGDKQVVLSALNGLANSYQALSKWPQAILFYQKALGLSQQLQDKLGETDNETSLAEVYGLQGNQAEALAHGLRARQLVQQTHDSYNLPAVQLMLARAYLLEQKTDSAIALAQHGLRLSQQTHSNDNIRKAYDILAEAHAQRRDFEQAYTYRNLHLAYNDTLSGKDTQRKTIALRYGYELDKKQTQITLLTRTRQLQAQKAARQRLQLYGLLAGLGGGILVVLLLLRNIFLKQRTNRRLNEKNTEIATQRDTLNRTLTELQATQTQLVQREKMASLGELMAGIAHEIQNPLNFITNFADINVELVTELEEELAKESLTVAGKPLLSSLLHDLVRNQTKVQEHSKRADRIVKSMLEHSRSNGGQRQATDINALVEGCLRLAYSGWRTKNKDFNATLTTELGPDLAQLAVIPQDLGRVLLNLLTNAFYAVAAKSRQGRTDYQPQVCVRTCQTLGAVQIQVRDNGNGIPLDIREKIFQPFFTTKPPGEGTGLGLSLSYDIVTKGHGGTLSVESQEDFTQFTISLPKAGS